jgi:hypothetical protein
MGKGISETLSTKPWPSALATVKAQPMIRLVTGCTTAHLLHPSASRLSALKFCLGVRADA